MSHVRVQVMVLYLLISIGCMVSSPAIAVPRLSIHSSMVNLAAIYSPVKFTVIDDEISASPTRTVAFWAEQDGKRSVLRDYAPSSEYTWIPLQAGVYQLGASLRQSNDQPEPAEIHSETALTVVAVSLPRDSLRVGVGQTVPIQMDVAPANAVKPISLNALTPETARVIVKQGRYFVKGIKTGQCIMQARLGDTICKGMVVEVFSPKLEVLGAAPIPGSDPQTWITYVVKPSTPKDDELSNEDGSRVWINLHAEGGEQNTPFKQIIWKGGDADAENHDTSRRSVNRARSGITDVTVTADGVSTTARIIVCRVERLEPVSASLYRVDASQLVTSVSRRYPMVEVRAVIMPDLPKFTTAYANVLQWRGGLPGTTADRRLIERRQPGKQTLSVECGDSSANSTVWEVHASLELLDTTIPAHGDLVPLAMHVEPPGVGGVVSLDTSHARAVQVYPERRRQGTHFDERQQWNLAKQPAPPTVVWLAGLTATAHPQTLRLTYQWGALSVCSAVSATISPGTGRSGVALHVLPVVEKDGQLLPTAQEQYNSIGERVFGSIEITLAPGERIAGLLPERLVFRISEESELHAPGAAQYDIPVAMQTADGWQQQVQIAGCSTWRPAGVAPKFASNVHGATPLVLRRLVFWDTTRRPLGHNGLHSLSLLTLAGKPFVFSFQRSSGNTTYRKPVVRACANVQNMLITTAHASDGCEDYIRYAPWADHPTFSKASLVFQFIDPSFHPGDSYRCNVTLLDVEYTGITHWTKTFTSIPIQPVHVPVPPEFGHSIVGFDVEITKLRGAEVIDSQRWLSEYLTFSIAKGDLVDNESYYIYRISGIPGCHPLSEARVDAIGGLLTRGDSVYGPTTLDIQHKVPAPEDPGEVGMSYTLVTGIDNEGYRYRDHRNRHLLPDRGR